MSKISQREARRLRKRVAELEEEQAARLAKYRLDYPGGVQITSIDSLSDFGKGTFQTATRMNAALVCKYDEGTGRLRVYAVLP